MGAGVPGAGVAAAAAGDGVASDVGGVLGKRPVAATFGVGDAEVGASDGAPCFPDGVAAGCRAGVAVERLPAVELSTGTFGDADGCGVGSVDCADIWSDRGKVTICFSMSVSLYLFLYVCCSAYDLL